MKNVTITLDETVAQWARVEAAKAGKSLSRWIGERLENERRRDEATTRSLSDWMKEPLWQSTEGALPSRAELYEQHYDRPGFRGHEHGGLHEGPARPLEGGEGHGVADGARTDETSRR